MRLQLSFKSSQFRSPNKVFLSGEVESEKVLLHFLTFPLWEIYFCFKNRWQKLLGINIKEQQLALSLKKTYWTSTAGKCMQMQYAYKCWSNKVFITIKMNILYTLWDITPRRCEDFICSYLVPHAFNAKKIFIFYYKQNDEFGICNQTLVLTLNRDMKMWPPKERINCKK